jgi:acyl carrier protein
VRAASVALVLFALAAAARSVSRASALPSKLPAMPIPSTVKSEIFAAIATLLEDDGLRVTDETPLVGSESLLDSMKLVELCLQLEDIATRLGFEFDWTSEAAMSKSRSMFRTAGALATEFFVQMETRK